MGRVDQALGGAVEINSLTGLLKLFCIFSIVAVFIYSHRYVIEHGMERANYYLFALMGLLGIFFAISANYLWIIFVGVEVLSLSLYSMHTYCSVLESNKASADKKYLLCAVFASALMLLGMVMIYLTTQTLEIGSIRHVLFAEKHSQLGLFNLGLGVFVFGMLLKSVIPVFYTWWLGKHDVDFSAVSIYLATLPKIALFGILYRLVFGLLPKNFGVWPVILIGSAIALMVIAAYKLLRGKSIKALLGYVAMFYFGMTMVGLALAKGVGYDGYLAAAFNTVVYSIMIAGIYGVVMMCAPGDKKNLMVNDFVGLGRQHKWLAFLMLILLLSMIGLPGTVGFYARFLILEAVSSYESQWLFWLISVLCLVMAWPFIYWVYALYFLRSDTPPPDLDTRSDFRILIGVNALLVVGFGLFPESLIQLLKVAF
jgi:NADH-quinone oxidoreductase subunit N